MHLISGIQFRLFIQRNALRLVIIGWGTFITAILVAGPAVADDACPAYIWITCGEQIRQKDGSLTQRYYVGHNEEIRLDGNRGLDLEAFCLFDNRSPEDKGYSKLPIACDSGKRYLDINCRANAHLELFVVGTCGGKRFMAQTAHSLFGKAFPATQKEAASMAELPDDLPRLRLRPSRRNYYMQTGIPYQFSYTGKGGAPKIADIIENQKRLLSIPLAPGDVLTYTPPQDPELDRTGPYDFKETVLLVNETAAGIDYATTFTLLLHRSYTAHLQLLPGVTLFGLTAALTLFVVLMHKRRPWYA